MKTPIQNLFYILACNIILLSSCSQNSDSNTSISNQTKNFYFPSKGLDREGLIRTLSSNFTGNTKLSGEVIEKEVKLLRSFTASKYLDRPQSSPWQLDKKDDLGFHARWIYNPKASPQIRSHLVVFIPGFGGDNSCSYCRYLSESLVSAGMHVVVLDSPASERYMEESSELGVPGHQSNDALELLEASQLAKHYVEKNGYNVSQISFIGTSLGGLNVQQMVINNLKLEKPIDFHTALSINPPYRNSYSLALIDQMIQENNQSSTKENVKSILEVLTFKPLLGIAYDQLKSACDELLGSKLTIQDSRGLIGDSFSKTVGETYKGFLKRYSQEKKDDTISEFHDLFNKITRKYYYSSGDQSKLTTEAILDQSSIKANIEQLNQIENYHVITFQDDFLLSSEDLTELYIKGKQRDILTVPGGHLGGFYQLEFQHLIRQILLK